VAPQAPVPCCGTKATFRRKDIQVSWLRQLMQPLFLILAEAGRSVLAAQWRPTSKVSA
jgi:hypothetical protein